MQRNIVMYSVIWLLVIILICFLFYKFYFLRQPDRNIPNNNSLFVAPANGTVVQILERDEEKIPVEKKHKFAFETFTNDVASGGYLVSIMMTPLNVHYQKAPTDAKIIYQKHTDGNFFNAMSEWKLNDVVFENERNEILFETEAGMKYKTIQIAGKLARKIVSFVEVGQELKQWDTYGLIKLGSQVTIVLPKDGIELQVKTWDVVIDGESIIANILK